MVFRSTVKRGSLNAITDVTGVCVGHQNVSDNVNINTGVTAILPRGNNQNSGTGNGIDTFVMAAWFTINANGEMTGTMWIEESGIPQKGRSCLRTPSA